MLLKLKDFSYLIAHVMCCYEDLLHEENQEAVSLVWPAGKGVGKSPSFVIGW